MAWTTWPSWTSFSLNRRYKTLKGLPQWVGLLERARGTLGLQLPSGRLRVTIQEPEVRFHPNGHIVIRGYAAAPGVRQPLRLVMAPRASAGELVFDFVEGTLGPVSVPDTLVNLVGTGLAHLILAGSDYVEITKIEVSDGLLTLDGRYLR